MTQPAMSIVFQGMEIIGEKRRDHLFFPWQDLVVPRIRKEPKRADVSLKDLSQILHTLLNIVNFP